MILYHFPTSLFARRVRLVLALKGLTAELAARVASRNGSPTLCADQWSAADIAVYCLVTWLEGLPARAAHFAPAAQVVALGWSLPRSLSAWADQHRTRPDIVALG